MKFFFDFISPFAYLGWKRINAFAAEHDRELEPVPILFAALLQHHGQLGPAEIPPKRVFVAKQVMRRAHDLGVSFQIPPSHPFNPLMGLRLASLELPRPDRTRLIDTLFDAVWAEGVGITDPEAVAARLDGIGLDGGALVARTADAEVKALVRAATDEAIALGVFGVPTLIVDGELFWGADSLDDAARFLRGEDPVSDDVLARWADVRPSASRKR